MNCERWRKEMVIDVTDVISCSVSLGIMMISIISRDEIDLWMWSVMGSENCLKEILKRNLDFYSVHFICLHSFYCLSFTFYPAASL